MPSFVCRCRGRREARTVPAYGQGFWSPVQSDDVMDHRWLGCAGLRFDELEKTTQYLLSFNLNQRLWLNKPHTSIFDYRYMGE